MNQGFTHSRWWFSKVPSGWDQGAHRSPTWSGRFRGLVSQPWFFMFFHPRKKLGYMIYIYIYTYVHITIIIYSAILVLYHLKQMCFFFSSDVKKTPKNLTFRKAHWRTSPLTERGIGVVLLNTTATGLHEATELLTSEGMTVPGVSRDVSNGRGYI